MTTNPFHIAEPERDFQIKTDALQLGTQSSQLQWNLWVCVLNHADWTSTRTKAAKECSWGYYRLWDPGPPQKLALCKCTNPSLDLVCAQHCKIVQTQRSSKGKKNPSGSETNTLLLLMNLFIYAGDQVTPHDFTRHFSLWSLFPKQSQEKLTKPKVSSFRYLLKTNWAVELKVKAKSTAIPVFTGLCIQSSESYDKCTVQH